MVADEQDPDREENRSQGVQGQRKRIGAPRAADTDGDGIDDKYEDDIGWDPLNSATATQNADGDAYNNLTEYQWDYQPTSSNSAPPTSQKLILCTPGSNGVQHSDYLLLAVGDMGALSSRIRVRPFSTLASLGRRATWMVERAEGTSDRFSSMSAQIEAEKKQYYLNLEQSQKGDTDITSWPEWFLNCLGRAVAGAEDSLADVLRKAGLWESINSLSPMNERQRRVINRLLDGFEGSSPPRNTPSSPTAPRIRPCGISEP